MTRETVRLLMGVLAVASMLAAADDPEKKKRKLGEDAVTDAYYVCAVFDNMEQVTACDVEVNFTKPNTVDVTLPMSASEARKLCKSIPDLIHKQGATKLRKDGWYLRFKSPFSGDNAIARCKF